MSDHVPFPIIKIAPQLWVISKSVSVHWRPDTAHRHSECLPAAAASGKLSVFPINIPHSHCPFCSLSLLLPSLSSSSSLQQSVSLSIGCLAWQGQRQPFSLSSQVLVSFPFFSLTSPFKSLSHLAVSIVFFFAPFIDRFTYADCRQTVSICFLPYVLETSHCLCVTGDC